MANLQTVRSTWISPHCLESQPGVLSHIIQDEDIMLYRKWGAKIEAVYRLTSTSCVSISCYKINAMSWLTLVHSWVFASLFLQLLPWMLTVVYLALAGLLWLCRSFRLLSLLSSHSSCIWFISMHSTHPQAFLEESELAGSVWIN